MVPDGRFDVLVSPERPASYDGDWWPLEPGTASLWIRSVSDQWGNDRDPRIAITRVDAPRRDPALGDATRKQLGALGFMVERIVEYGMKHVDELIDEGFVNQLKTVDYGNSGGDAAAALPRGRVPAGRRRGHSSWRHDSRRAPTTSRGHSPTGCS